MENSLLIKNARLSDGRVLNIFCREGRIRSMGAESPGAERIIEAGGRWLMPGIIDVHTHIRDMELSHKEDWASASASAARGGVTSLCDMPNTRPATFDLPSLEAKWAAARKSLVNYGVNFGVTENNHRQIEQARGINALKMFMAESSAGYVVQQSGVIRRVLRLSQKLNKPLMVHSELQSCVEEHHKRYSHDMAHHHLLRHRECAIEATRLLLQLQKEEGGYLYIAHVATAEEAAMIAAAKAAGQTVWFEVTPHHLFLNTGHLKNNGNIGKVNPPIRQASDNRALQQALIDGHVDTIGTDHAPHTLGEKNKPYDQAPSGFPGLETSLALMLRLVHEGRISRERLEELMCRRPAEIFGIKDRGCVREGAWADLIIIDEEKSWTVDPAAFFTKARYSPFAGMRLRGAVVTTIVNGRPVWHEGRLYPSKGMQLEYR